MRISGARWQRSRAPTACQLYLVLEVHAAAREHLAAILARLPVASVLFKPARGTALTAAAVKPLVDLTQSNNVAALLLDDVALARTLRADGVHLSAGPDVLQRYREAREILGGRAIVGADAGGSRHARHGTRRSRRGLRRVRRTRSRATDHRPTTRRPDVPEARSTRTS